MRSVTERAQKHFFCERRHCDGHGGAAEAVIVAEPFKVVVNWPIWRRENHTTHSFMITETGHVL
jgi:hypothetical protein